LTFILIVSEVISQSGYNQRADIWSLGITAIEMAKCFPPNHNLHPMKAMMEIGRSQRPPSLDGNFSADFKDFVACCLKRNPMERWTAEKLLDHKFIKSAKKRTILIPLVERKGLVSGPSKRESVPEEVKPVEKQSDQQEFEWEFDEKSGTVKMNKSTSFLFDNNSGTIKSVKKTTTKSNLFDDSSVRVNDSSVRFNDSSVRIAGGGDDDSSVRVKRREIDDDSSVVVRNSDSSVVIRPGDPSLENIFDDSSVVIKKTPSYDDSSVVVRKTPSEDSSVVIKDTPIRKQNIESWDFGDNDGSVVIKKERPSVDPVVKAKEPKSSRLLTSVILDAIPDGVVHDDISSRFLDMETKNPKGSQEFLTKLIGNCQNSSDLSIQALIPIFSSTKQDLPLDVQSNPLVDVLYQRWVQKGRINYM
jgi:serine/threonine protein kinase